MARMDLDQIARRERIEGLIRLAAPALNAVLAVGDRVSRVIEPDDPEYYPPRSAAAAADVPRPGRPSENTE